MDYFTISNIVKNSAVRLHQEIVFQEQGSSNISNNGVFNEVNIILTKLKSMSKQYKLNHKLICAIVKEFFNTKCHKRVWNKLEVPYSDKTILFYCDILSDNGKLAMMCRNTSDNNIKNTILEAVFTYFLMTQKNHMYSLSFTDPLTSNNIDEKLRFLLLINGKLYEIELTSPDVIWLYISHKLEMSKKLETAQQFDVTHPENHKYEMLECAFKLREF